MNSLLSEKLRTNVYRQRNSGPLRVYTVIIIGKNYLYFSLYLHTVHMHLIICQIFNVSVLKSFAERVLSIESKF